MSPLHERKGSAGEKGARRRRAPNRFARTLNLQGVRFGRDEVTLHGGAADPIKFLPAESNCRARLAQNGFTTTMTTAKTIRTVGTSLRIR